jgi:hypothetical protein
MNSVMPSNFRKRQLLPVVTQPNTAGTGVFSRSLNMRNVGAIAGGTAAGALIGRAVGHSGKGTLIGALVGGAASTAAVAASKGYQASVAAGQEMHFTTVSSMTVRT